MSSTSYFHHGSRYVTRFQDFAPNYGEYWRQCPVCGWWDPIGDSSRVLPFFAVWDTFMCGDCLNLEEPSASTSISLWLSSQMEGERMEWGWLKCCWCGWCYAAIAGISRINEMREIENYDCHSRCDRCQQFDEPPWWPNNRQRYAKKLIHLLPTVRTAITATETVERPIPDEAVRLIAEYLAANIT